MLNTATHPDPSGILGTSDGFVAFVKEGCPTCTLVAPVLAELRHRAFPLAIFTQDDPDFPPGLDSIHDTDLSISYHLGIQTVPTLIRMDDGREVERVVGWSRAQWEELTGEAGLGTELPEHRPGCGSRSVEPGIAEELAVRFGASSLASRQIELGRLEDAIEAGFERGWSDGLPVVPPTPARVLAMLEGTERDPQEVIGSVPPSQNECTVEKIAINAVLAGCKPDYLPVVIAAVKAACDERFNAHGVLCTTSSVSPVVIVNGPVRRGIGMNSGLNALGQGNRANATIGRALQLVIRNVGGGRPGEIDRATLGNPGKYTFCFAEDEENSPWESLAVERGFSEDASTVTLFAGEGPRGVVDERARDPEPLARSFAACLRTIGHPKMILAEDALMVISPEHARIFRQAGWNKQRLRNELVELLKISGEELLRGAGGMAEGLPPASSDETVPRYRKSGGEYIKVDIQGMVSKFHPDQLLFVHAGSRAGLISAIIGGWLGGELGSIAVTKEIRS